MWQCYYCRSPLPLDVQKKNRLCPHCGSDIHCCKNCSHYDESISAKCREPNSPWIRDRVAQNNCSFFEFQAEPGPTNQDGQSSEAEQAKEAFRALFRNP